MLKRLGLFYILLIAVIQLTGCTLLQDEKKPIPGESEVLCYFNQHFTELQAAADILLNHSEQIDKTVDPAAFDTWLFTSGPYGGMNHMIDSVVSDTELDEIQPAWASLDAYPGSMVMYYCGLSCDTPAITHSIYCSTNDHSVIPYIFVYLRGTNAATQLEIISMNEQTVTKLTPSGWYLIADCPSIISLDE